MEDSRQEDLDLLSLFKSIKRGIINLFKSLIYLIEFSIRHLVIVVIFVGVFTAAGYGLYSLKKTYYESELLVTHVRFENDFCREMVDNLNMIINESNDNATLAEVLSMNPDEAKYVKWVKYKPLNEHVAKLYADSVSVMLPFKIQVEVYSTEILDTLQVKLVNYLEKNEYALVNKALDAEALRKIDRRLDTEIQSLDSLKGLVEKSVVPQRTGNGIIMGEPINPVDVYEAAIKLYEKKLETNKKQKLNDSFSIVVGFPESHRAGVGKLLFMAFGALTGYLLGLIVASMRARKNN